MLISPVLEDSGDLETVEGGTSRWVLFLQLFENLTVKLDITVIEVFAWAPLFAC